MAYFGRIGTIFYTVDWRTTCDIEEESSMPAIGERVSIAGTVYEIDDVEDCTGGWLAHLAPEKKARTT